MVTASPDIVMGQGQGEAVEEGGEDKHGSGQGEPSSSLTTVTAMARPRTAD